MALRKRELAVSTRPFNARGSKVIRCESCLLPRNDCICAEKPAPSAHCAVVLLMFKGECFKPTNTGRLIADVVENNFAWTWHRTEPPAELLALLADPRYQPMVIFPHESAEPERCISAVPSAGGKIPLFIFLDGTWREAGKMFRKSSYLQSLPVLGLHPEASSGYKLREAAHSHQLCTAEVGVGVLELAGEHKAAGDLLVYFQRFRENYLRSRPHGATKTHR